MAILPWVLWVLDASRFSPAGAPGPLRGRHASASPTRGKDPTRRRGLLEYRPVTTTEAPPMLSTVVPEPAAWHGPTLATERYLIAIPAAVLAEAMVAPAAMPTMAPAAAAPAADQPPQLPHEEP